MQSVRSLALPNFDHFQAMPGHPIAADMLLMRPFTALNHVSLGIHAASLHNGNGSPIFAGQLVARHSLHLLGNCVELKSISLCGVRHGPYIDLTSLTPLHHLQMRLQQDLDLQYVQGQRSYRVDVQMFGSFGYAFGWEKLAWNVLTAELEEVAACENWVKWPLIPCKGFVQEG